MWFPLSSLSAVLSCLLDGCDIYFKAGWKLALEKGAFLLSTCRGHCACMTNPGGDATASKLLLGLGLGAVSILLFPALTLTE